MDIYVKISFISIFSIFLSFSIMIMSYTLIIPTSQLQTQQPMTSQIRSHIKYLTQTYNILVLIMYSKLMLHQCKCRILANCCVWNKTSILRLFADCSSGAC